MDGVAVGLRTIADEAVRALVKQDRALKARALKALRVLYKTEAAIVRLGESADFDPAEARWALAAKAMALFGAEDAIRLLGEPVRWKSWEHRIGDDGEMRRRRIEYREGGRGWKPSR